MVNQSIRDLNQSRMFADEITYECGNCYAQFMTCEQANENHNVHMKQAKISNNAKALLDNLKWCVDSLNYKNHTLTPPELDELDKIKKLISELESN